MKILHEFWRQRNWNVDRIHGINTRLPFTRVMHVSVKFANNIFMKKMGYFSLTQATKIMDENEL